MQNLSPIKEIVVDAENAGLNVFRLDRLTRNVTKCSADHGRKMGNLQVKTSIIPGKGVNEMSI
jgi:hypothetical protein